MRGKAFHNRIVEDTRKVFENYRWQVFTEHRYPCGESETYFDIFARKGHHEIACEVETTIRHLEDNADKAISAKVELLIIVPTRKLLKEAQKRLGNTAKVILPDQLASTLQERKAS